MKDINKYINKFTARKRKKNLLFNYLKIIWYNFRCKQRG